MEKLPSVIPTAIIHIINTLESDSEHRYQWKLSRNLENVSLFVKCEFRAKSVEGDQPPFPVRQKPGNKKHKSPSRLRRQRARKQRFQEKKTAEKADSHTSPASEVNSAVLQEQEPTANLQEPEPACVTSIKDSSDLDNTGQIQDLICGSDKCSENNPVLSPDSDIGIETERALLLEVLQQTDSDDNSFHISEVISEINTCSNCKRQPEAGVELKRCSHCQITKYCSVDCQKKDWDFHRCRKVCDEEVLTLATVKDLCTCKYCIKDISVVFRHFIYCFIHIPHILVL